MRVAHRESMVIDNDTSHLERVRGLVDRGFAEGGFPPVAKNRIAVAVAEAVTNIIEHGYADLESGRGVIRIKQEVSPDAYRITIEDDGQGYDPTRRNVDINMREHVKSGQSGGLGIFLIRSIMDVVEYSYEKGIVNRLVLVKHAASIDA